MDYAKPCSERLRPTPIHFHPLPLISIQSHPVSPIPIYFHLLPPTPTHSHLYQPTPICSHALHYTRTHSHSFLLIPTHFSCSQPLPLTFSPLLLILTPPHPRPTHVQPLSHISSPYPNTVTKFNQSPTILTHIWSLCFTCLH